MRLTKWDIVFAGSRQPDQLVEVLHFLFPEVTAPEHPIAPHRGIVNAIAETITTLAEADRFFKVLSHFADNGSFAYADFPGTHNNVSRIYLFGDGQVTREEPRGSEVDLA